MTRPDQWWPDLVKEALNLLLLRVNVLVQCCELLAHNGVLPFQLQQLVPLHLQPADVSQSASQAVNETDYPPVNE
jgi:hypothetical protein